MDWDVFISHAWEDKEALARPLAKALEEAGLRVWYDEFTLDVGDSLRRSIDRGLANSRYGVVIPSPSFFQKEWPQKELDGLAAREVVGSKVILPVWHNLTADQVRQYSPMLADRLAVSSSRGVEYVVAELLRATGFQVSSSSPTRHTRRSLLQENKLSMWVLIGTLVGLALLGVTVFMVFGQANRTVTTPTAFIAAAVDMETPTTAPTLSALTDTPIPKTTTVVALSTLPLVSPSATRPRTPTPTRTVTATLTPAGFKYPAPFITSQGNTLYTADGRLVTWNFPFQLAEDEWYEVSGRGLEGAESAPLLG